MSKEENKQASAQGHGMTSEEAREAGLGKGDLQPGKDFVVEYGREGQSQTKSGDTPPDSQPLNDNMNADDISQRQGTRDYSGGQ